MKSGRRPGPEILRAKRGGNKPIVDLPEVMNGLKCLLSTGCQWRPIPKNLPPRSTVKFNFLRWQHDSTLARLHRAIYERCRKQADHATRPAAAIIDSQRIRALE